MEGLVLVPEGVLVLEGQPATLTQARRWLHKSGTAVVDALEDMSKHRQ